LQEAPRLGESQRQRRQLEGQPINSFTFQSEESLTQKLHCSKIDRVYDDAGNLIQTHEHKGDFKEW
jgi:hypothetical protein